jgi:hypothetical protein
VSRWRLNSLTSADLQGAATASLRGLTDRLGRVEGLAPNCSPVVDATQTAPEQRHAPKRYSPSFGAKCGASFTVFLLLTTDRAIIDGSRFSRRSYRGKRRP